MRRSLWGWTIAWAAAWVGFFTYLYLIVTLGTTSLFVTLEEDESAAVCCMGPVWFLFLVATGIKLWGRWRFELQRSHAPVVGKCTACGYDTTGLTGLCPECGSPVESGAWVPTPKSQHATGRIGLTRWTARRQAVAWLAVCVLFLVSTIAVASVADPSGQSDIGGPGALVGCTYPIWVPAMAVWAVWIVWHWDDSTW